MGEKRCPKWPTASPTIRLLVADGLYVTSLKERLQSLHTLCEASLGASYVAWRADQVLYSSYTLDIYSGAVESNFASLS